MKLYWAGLANIPVAVAGASAVVAAAVGAHRLAYSWAEKRIVTLGQVQAPISLGTGELTELVTRTKFNGRQAFAALMLTAKHAQCAVLGPNTAVILLHSKPADPSLSHLLNKALEDLVVVDTQAAAPGSSCNSNVAHNFS